MAALSLALVRCCLFTVLQWDNWIILPTTCVVSLRVSEALQVLIKPAGSRQTSPVQARAGHTGWQKAEAADEDRVGAGAGSWRGQVCLLAKSITHHTHHLPSLFPSSSSSRQIN